MTSSLFHDRSGLDPAAKKTVRHSTYHFILLQPDIPAALTPIDSAAGNVRPAFPTNIDDDLSISGADLQRDETIGGFRVYTAKSTDTATHSD